MSGRDPLLCVDCNDRRTDNKQDGDAVCASCSNSRFSAKLSRGEIVELRLDMTKVRQSTLLKIKAMIQEDEEKAE